MVPMAFTVTDFDDFMAVLRAKPEWQAELRHLLVGEELAAINRSIDRLDETLASFIAWSKEMFERMDRRLSRIENDMGTLATNVSALTADVGTLKTNVSTLTADVGTLKTDVGTLKADVGTLKTDVRTLTTDVGTLKGWRLEAWYRDRATAVFGHVLDKVKVISPGDLRSFWKDGVLSEEEWRDIRRLDLLIEGVDDDGNRRRAAVEISFRADAGDLERAVRRAAIVARTGMPCWPVVATTEVAPEMGDLVRGRAAALLRDGDVEYWPEAG